MNYKRPRNSPENKKLKEDTLSQNLMKAILTSSFKFGLSSILFSENLIIYMENQNMDGSKNEYI